MNGLSNHVALLMGLLIVVVIGLVILVLAQ
jgi:hypothetical protein